MRLALVAGICAGLVGIGVGQVDVRPWADLDVGQRAADLKVSTTYDKVSGDLIVDSSIAVPTFRSARQSTEGGTIRSAPLGTRAATMLEPALKAASELPRLHSLLVWQRGEVILERYFNGRRATSLSNVKSVSKSIVSSLVGIAVDRKLLALNHTLATHFPELADPEKRAITIEDLLTMRSGLESTSNRNYGAWVQSRNWVRHALAMPLVVEPGTQMIYSTGNTHILSALLTKVTGKSTWQFAQESLAKPLGFSLAQWPRDPQGIFFGGNDMLLTPRQMLAIGEMYLNDGLASGRRVVPEEWIEESFEPRGRSRISGREYGYGWWIREMAGRQAYYAWGFGGQFIVLVPSLDVVVVSTSAATISDDRRDHRRTVDEIIEYLIVSPLGSL
jgi:CubicO group peptidase (beta-lactamase class C family)